MRYGKVYFYDRMGNREPSEAEKIREALENFEAPRFRPPDEPRLSKNYTTAFSPLETPPPISGDSSIANRNMFTDAPNMDIPANIANFADIDPDQDLRLPAHLAGGTDCGMRNMDRLAMDLPPEIYPDDPMPRIVSTPPINNLKFNLGEDISTSIDKGLMNGFASDSRNVHFDMEGIPKNGTAMDRITQNLGNIRFDEQEKMEHFTSDDYYGHEICAQCMAEDEYMDRVRRKAEEERAKYEETLRKAKIYDSEMQQKEQRYKQEELERSKALRDHVNRINAELIEIKKNRPKSPEVENYIFRHESPRKRDADIRSQKEIYRAELDKQIEEKRLRRIAEFEKNEAIDVTSNANAALEFARARENERKTNEHAKEMAKKQLEFQMEMGRIGAPSDKNWLWWAERPDEHGWREARLRAQKHTNQVERNEMIKGSIAHLEEFKSRQSHDDSVMRDMRRAKYDKIREQLHHNSNMLYPLKKTESRPLIVQPNPKVEAAWREAHEKHDKKFTVLQDNAMRSHSGAALEGASSTHVATSCRRCARCARPLERKTAVTVGRGETILPHNLTWYRS